MKKILVLLALFCCVISTYSQIDSLFLKDYKQTILENSKLKNDLQIEKQNVFDLSIAYKKDTLALQKQIKDLKQEVSILNQKVSDLNKEKIKEERDYLQKKVDSLNIVIFEQNQTIENKDKQIINEQNNTKTLVDNAIKKGKTEALSTIVAFYINRSFDDLIISSSKESVARDLLLVGNNSEVKQVLIDLQTYFNALELLSQKFNVEEIQKAQTQLNNIKRKSNKLDAIKEYIDNYKDFNTELIITINKLINFDKVKSAELDSEIQKKKFEDILKILTDYIYNYYDYDKYPYLYEIVHDIIKHKKVNADADITDLLKKL